MTSTTRCLLILVITLAIPPQTARSQNTAKPSNHLGNVFLLGETVSIPAPDLAEGLLRWQITDEMQREIAIGESTLSGDNPIELEKLPVGWHRVAFLDSSGKELGWTTAAVLPPLVAPTPDDSPICVDSATAWFAKDDPATQEKYARLAALAGVNWIRDRIRWREIQPAENEFAADTTYDSSAAIQHRHGLKVLQVFHDTPPWAAGAHGRGHFPDDLRHVYRFAKAMSQRFKGKVQAWEPWNEANVANFGGHTFDEICSYQKAAYLGFKAGDPDVTVGWTVTTSVPTERQTDTVLLNEACSYFDTYNIHTYDWAHDYTRLWKPSRRAASGKPLWITESDRGMKSDPSSPTHDLSGTNERLKAQYVTQSYVHSLYAGAYRHFHFVLGQYGEGETQFGLLRHDLTPRAGYVALATLGRLLAGARCLGRLEQPNQPDLHVYAFRARPDGLERDVLVAWTEKNTDWPNRGKAQCQWQLPADLTPQCCVDYLGRNVPITTPLQITSAPIFLVLPKNTVGQVSNLPTVGTGRRTVPRITTRSPTQPASPPPSSNPAGQISTPSPTPIVLQCLLPPGTAQKIDRIPWASEYEYQIPPNKPYNVPLYAYNFSPKPVRGTIHLENLPAGCHANPTTWNVDLAPMDRVELPATITITPGTTADTHLTLRGNFAQAGSPTLTFRLQATTP